MVVTHQKQPRLKFLLENVPPGFMVDTPWLRHRAGVNPKSIHEYVMHGWLERVIRGLYRRPLPDESLANEDDWVIPLLSMQWIMGRDVHLGGESALSLAGYFHFLMLGQRRRVHVYGDVPTWLERLPTQASFESRTRSLFGNSVVGIEGGRRSPQLPGYRHWRIRASAPERAILEALDELPNNASFSNLDKVFFSLGTLRPALLMQLLTACRSIKVRRLFFLFADRHEHPWLNGVPSNEIDLGSGPRSLVKGGKFDPKYRISVPREFAEMSDLEF